MTIPSLYVHVAIPLPVEGPFDYIVPPELHNAVAVGKRVWVPFGRKKRIIGFIVNISHASFIANLKPIHAVIDDEVLISPKILELTRWIADHYFCSWGEAIAASLPAFFSQGRKLRAKTDSSILSSHIVSSPAASNGSSQISVLDQPYSERVEEYRRIITQQFHAKRSVIICAPEGVSLERLRAALEDEFRDMLVVFHSALPEKQRRLIWGRLLSDERVLVVGTRSAIFAPVKNVGAIILDESHSHLYKQEEVPRFHVRDVARKRAELESCSLLFGSLTPSLETYYYCRKGSYHCVPEKDGKRQQPASTIKLVDLRAEVDRYKGRVHLSNQLEGMIKTALSKKEKIMLILNRRGFATSLRCPKCAKVLQCPHCSVSLVFHAAEKKYCCHSCHFYAEENTLCPHCNSAYVKYRGMGTERLERELLKIFPEARVKCVDRDVLLDKARAQRFRAAVRKGTVDILIGTHAATQFLRSMRPHLVGVIMPDMFLHIPDFRAAEKAFSFLFHLAHAVDGIVAVQTYQPEHPVMRFIQHIDREGFYKAEYDVRKDACYPPWCHLIYMRWRGKDRDAVIAESTRITDRLCAGSDGTMKIFGPFPDSIAQRRGLYRYKTVIKTSYPIEANGVIKKTLDGLGRSGKIITTVDVDPL